MSNSFASTVELRLRPSMRALRWVFAIHLIVIALLPMAVHARLPLLLMLFALLLSWFWLRRHAAFGFGPRAIDRLIWHADGRWTVYRGAQAIAVELLGSSFLHRQLLVLNFRSAEGSRLTRVIAGDEVEVEALRRLRARLLLGQR